MSQASEPRRSVTLEAAGRAGQRPAADADQAPPRRRTVLDRYGRIALGVLAVGVLLLRCSAPASEGAGGEARSISTATVPAAASAPPLADCGEAARSLRGANSYMSYVLAHPSPGFDRFPRDLLDRLSVATRAAPAETQLDAEVVVAGLSAFDTALGRRADGPDELRRALTAVRPVVEGQQYQQASSRLAAWLRQRCAGVEQETRP